MTYPIWFLLIVVLVIGLLTFVSVLLGFNVRVKTYGFFFSATKSENDRHDIDT